MNADLSVAPEIAQLAAPLTLVPSALAPSAQGRGPAARAGAAPHAPHTPSARLTTGQLAAELSRLAAAPERWWDLVQFNPDRPARIAVPASFEAWLLVIPPGQTAECRCVLGTQIAGDAVEVAGSAEQPASGAVSREAAVSKEAVSKEAVSKEAVSKEAVSKEAAMSRGVARQLRPGRVLVHAPGNQHVIRGAGHGYAVTLHAGERG